MQGATTQFFANTASRLWFLSLRVTNDWRVGRPGHVTLSNQCDHAECERELGSQAISYPTGVPAVAGASMLLSGKWAASGVWNVEQFDPDPFLAETSRLRLTTDVLETSPDRSRS
jgi:saccharopine dehydrogenase-like NADP-dependent oxidoreductase